MPAAKTASMAATFTDIAAVSALSLITVTTTAATLASAACIARYSHGCTGRLCCHDETLLRMLSVPVNPRGMFQSAPAIPDLPQKGK